MSHVQVIIDGDTVLDMDVVAAKVTTHEPMRWDSLDQREDYEFRCMVGPSVAFDV